MTRAKRPARRRSNPRTRRARPTPRLGKFLRALWVSAVASFSAVSCALHPGLQGELSLEKLEGLVGWPQAAHHASLVAPSGPLAQTRFEDCPQFFPHGKPPIVPAAANLRELCFSEFAILHDGDAKTPVFVAQRLDRRTLQLARGNDRTDRFYAEARLPRADRAELDDYRGSGYSRGHMAPAADMATGQGMAQSFSLANMVPQDQKQNGGPWSRIEQDTRKYVLRTGGDVYVFTGPVYAGDHPKTVGKGVAVPDFIFKLVFDEASGRSWVHWQPNAESARAGAPISYEAFLRQTGMQLLP